MLRYWAHNPIAANLTALAIVLVGAFTFSGMEREVYPSFQKNEVNVLVRWPGAAPLEIESQIIKRIEEAVSSVEEIKRISATAREGRAFVSIVGENRADTQQLLNRVKNAVSAIGTFPVGAYPPIVRQAYERAPAMYVALYGDMESRRLFRMARSMRDEIATLANVTPTVEIWGVIPEEISIEVSEASLRRYQLTFDEIVAAIRGASLNRSIGEVRGLNGSIRLSTWNLADTAAEFEAIVIRSNANGVLRVGDVATVIDGIEDFKSIQEMNGELTVTFNIQNGERADVTALSGAVNDWVARKNAELGGEASLFVWFDFADFYRSQMQLVSTNAIIGLALVFLILVLFLRLSVAVWVCAGIVVAFAGAFIMLPLVGVSLNMISLFGFFLVIGLIVDDSIVVGESIHNAVENGEVGAAAGVNGVRQVSRPVIFAAVTTMIAMAPLIAASGDTAQIAKHISYPIIFALGFSLIESLLILPAHLRHIKKQERIGGVSRLRFALADGLVFFAKRIYAPILRAMVAIRYLVCAAFASIFMLSIALVAQGWIPFQFVPQIQGSFLSLTVRLPDDAAWVRVEEVVAQVRGAAHQLRDELRAKHPDYVRSIYIGADEGDEETVTAYLTIVDSREREEATREVAEMFRDHVGAIADAENIAIHYTLNPTSPGLVLRLRGDGLGEMSVAIKQLEKELRSTPGVFDVRNSLQAARPEMRIKLRPGAERFDLSLAEVSRQVRQAFYGDEVQRLPRGGEDVRVMVRYTAEKRRRLDSLDTMTVRTADRREIPISAVAEFENAPQVKRIDRRDRRRTAIVTAEFRPGVDRTAIRQFVASEILPDIEGEFSDIEFVREGGDEEQSVFLSEGAIFALLVFFAVYSLLAVVFSSYFQPLLILIAAPFAFVGAAFGHLLIGVDFTFLSFVGVGAAAGIVVNDNIILLDLLNSLREKGIGLMDAIVEAGVSRFRPILLTSITTFVGLVPLMYEPSTDAQFLKPTVVALAFSVLFAMFVSFLLVPSLYMIGVDVSRAFSRTFNPTRIAQ